MADEAHAGGAPRLVVPLEAPLEVEDEPLEQQLPDVRELGVDDRRQGRVHVGEGGGGSLGLMRIIIIIAHPFSLSSCIILSSIKSLPVYLDDALAQQTPTTDNVLREEFPDDDGDVGTVHFVDQTVDGLLERLPGQPLVRLAALVRDVLLHHPQLGGRDVGATGLRGQQLVLLLPRLGRRALLLLSLLPLILVSAAVTVPPPPGVPVPGSGSPVSAPTPAAAPPVIPPLGSLGRHSPVSAAGPAAAAPPSLGTPGPASLPPLRAPAPGSVPILTLLPLLLLLVLVTVGGVVSPLPRVILVTGPGPGPGPASPLLLLAGVR